MFSSKSMMEYMTEMHRLLGPRSEDDDVQTPYSLSYQSPHQSATVNRSSSSTDSTSPESYSDLFRSDFPGRVETPKTTFTIRRQRAIVGRKILGNSQQTQQGSPVEKMDFDVNFWSHEESLSETPPNIQKNLYELFPTDRKPLDLLKSETRINLGESSPWSTTSSASHRSPINRSMSDFSPQYRSPVLPNPFNMSRVSPPWSTPTVNPLRYNSVFSSPSPQSKYPSFAGSSTDEIGSTKMCTFCRKNGETPIVYMTHCVKEKVDGQTVVTCPILRSHVCATCGATGDNAHTITYCPVLRSSNNGRPLQSTTITLKNTRIKSNGRRRY